MSLIALKRRGHGKVLEAGAPLRQPAPHGHPSPLLVQDTPTLRIGELARGATASRPATCSPA